MLSFHNDISIKEKYVKRVIKHRKLDNIIKGVFWENGKGCAVGCTLENYNHDRYPIELGIPIWLAKLEDEIFENLPNDESKFWPEIFLKSIPVGVCLEKVKHQLAIIRMDNLLEIQNKLLLKNEKNSEIFLKVINSIELIKKCHELELNNNYCELSNKLTEDLLCSAAESSRSAGWSAVESAWSVAWSAWSATWSSMSETEPAWSASNSASRSSNSAAWSARSAGWSAADSAVWSSMAETESAKRSARSAADSAVWSSMSETESAWSASFSAARSSNSSAWSARSSNSAAWSARSAGWSAVASARSSAWSAAWSARSEAWKKESDNLINLLKNCK